MPGLMGGAELSDRRSGLLNRMRMGGADLLNPVIGAAIALVVSGLFVAVVATSLSQLSTAPVAGNAEMGTDGYDAFARSVQVIGLVTPVLTTILGFYFGVRAGASGREAAESRADRAEIAAQDVVSDANAKIADTQKVITTLGERLAPIPEAAAVLQEVREEQPHGFEIEDWFRTVRRTSVG